MSDKLDLTLYPGLSFREVITRLDENGDPQNLSNWTAHAEVRAKPGTPLIVDLAPTIPSGGTTGQIVLELTSEVTKPLEPGDYQWDLILTDSASNRFLGKSGRAIVKHTITDAVAMQQPAS